MKGKTTKFILGIILPAMLVMSLGLVVSAPVSAAGLTSVTDTLTSDAAGATTTHTVGFTTASSLPINGKMKFAFQDGFDVSGATLGAVSGPDGNFSLTRDLQVLTVSRSGGTAFAAGAVTVALNNIVNHETAAATYTVDVVTTDAFSGYIDGPATSDAFEIVAADLDALVVVANPTNTVAGVTISTVTVRAEDEFGNIIKSADVDVDVALNQNSFASGSTTTETTDASGIATFDDLAIEKADTDYTMTFSSDAVDYAVSNKFDVTPDALDTLTITNEPTDPTTAGEAIGPVTVEALDQFDNPIEDVAVTVTEIGHTYTFSSGTLVQDTDASGIATFDDLVIDKADTDYQLHFAGGGKTDDSVLFDVVAAGLDALVVVADPTNTVAGDTISTVTVRAEDEFDNVIAGVDVDVALNQNAFASGTTTQATNASGIATFADLVITTAATDYTMTFSSGAVDYAVSNKFDVTPDVLDTLTIQVQPTQTVAGDAISPAVTVLAQDEFGNSRAGDDVLVTLSKNSFASGTTTRTTNASGIATFDDLVITTAATDYTMTFSKDAVASAASDEFAVVALNSLEIIDGPTDTVAGQVIQGASPVTVEARDNVGNPISGIIVAVTEVGHTYTFNHGTLTQTTDVDGIATFGDLVIDTANTNYQLHFANGAVNVDSDLFDVEAAAVETLTIVQQPSDAAAGAVIAPPVTVRAEDEFNNLIGGLDIDVTLLAGTGTLSGTTPQATAPSGIATFDDLSINLPGDKQLQFATGGLTVDSAEFDVGTPPAVALAEGWNLMSSPLIPNDPDIAVVLADIEDNVISVWYYDAAGEEWLIYSPPAFTSLTSIEDGKAYWIDMDAADTLWIDGRELPAPPGLPPVYDVVTGWNMVGFKSTADMSAADYLNAMAGKYTRIYGFDKGAWFAIPPPYAGNMEPGLGYWVSFTVDGAIYP